MPQETMLILASNSPRRRELMALGGWGFQVAPADVDETPLPGEPPREYALRIAAAKVQKVAGELRARLDLSPEALIVGADTIVVDASPLTGDLEILGKPAGEDDARRMLERLRGKTHQVYTALTVFRPGDGRQESSLVSTDVPMRAYTAGEIDEYIATGDPMDKAGAYAIQHEGFHPVAELHGCYSNVVGLPVCELIRTLGKFGVLPRNDLQVIRAAAHETSCPNFEKILQGDF